MPKQDLFHALIIPTAKHELMGNVTVIFSTK